jgi:hypothetical protein
MNRVHCNGLSKKINYKNDERYAIIAQIISKKYDTRKGWEQLLYK